jgi:signal peptide peptidase SppA
MTPQVYQYWMCQPQALRLFYETFSGLSLEQLSQIEASSKDVAAAPVTVAREGSVAVIEIKGILLQRIPTWLKGYIEKGYLEVSSLETIRQQVQMAAADPDIAEIRLQVHSPGGTVAGTLEAAEAISAAQKIKPVIAQVETLAGSGAYYLASQAGWIAAGADAEIGSIGVYAVYYDLSKMAEQLGIRAVVISTGAHKGMGVEGAPITDEQVAAVRGVIEGMAGHFVGAVAAGRGMKTAAVRKLADGRMWLAPQARQLGLIDDIQNGHLISTIERTQTMDSEQEKQEQAAALQKAAADAGAASMARMKALREAFADDLPFAMEQFEKGADVQQAKAAYCDILAARNKELAEKVQKAAVEKKKTPEAGATGAEPIPAGSSDAADGGTDAFVGFVQQYQTEGLSRGKAMSKTILLHPAEYAAHLQMRTVAVGQ